MSDKSENLATQTVNSMLVYISCLIGEQKAGDCSVPLSSSQDSCSTRNGWMYSLSKQLDSGVCFVICNHFQSGTLVQNKIGIVFLFVNVDSHKLLYFYCPNTVCLESSSWLFVQRTTNIQLWLPQSFFTLLFHCFRFTAFINLLL